MAVPKSYESTISAKATTRNSNASKFHESYPHVIKSHVAFGGGLILIGQDGEKKNIIPRPDITETIDGIGRPSPLEPETNYIGIRHLQKDEVQKLEGSRYSPTFQKEADDIKENFRPTDTLDHEKWRDPLQQAPNAGPDSKSSECEFGNDLRCIEREKRQHHAAFPIMTSQQLYNQCCENLMADGPKTPALMNMNKKWGAKKRWFKQLPATINTLPIFTIRVRWKLSPNLPSYSMELVHALLSRHGRITAMGQFAPNCAMVVFSDVETARRCLKCSTGVISSSPLICSWWFPEMCSYNKMIHEQKLREEKRVIIQLNESTLMRMEFRKIQEKCIIQFKKYQWGLSYDRSTFVK